MYKFREQKSTILSQIPETVMLNEQMAVKFTEEKKKKKKKKKKTQ